MCPPACRRARGRARIAGVAVGQGRRVPWIQSYTQLALLDVVEAQMRRVVVLVGVLSGAIAAGVVGGLIGFLLGIGVIVIPGVGPVLAAGTMVSVMSNLILGSGLGALFGGTLGLLIGLSTTLRRQSS